MTEPWLERWEEGRIGWHEPAGNSRLRKHWTATGRRVIVPLCGKTFDLIWLEQQGNDVVGVELSELAVRAFFEENGLSYSVHEAELPAFTADDRQITIVCGDYFAFTTDPFDAYFDRGALVALSADERPGYVEHTRSLLAANAETMIITLEYDQDVVDGPPYAVAADELLTYWPELRRVAADEDLANGPPKFRAAGLQEMIAVVWQAPGSPARRNPMAPQ